MFGGVIDRKNITSELWSFDLHTRKWHKEGGESKNLMVGVWKKVFIQGFLASARSSTIFRLLHWLSLVIRPM